MNRVDICIVNMELRLRFYFWVLDTINYAVFVGLYKSKIGLTTISFKKLHN